MLYDEFAFDGGMSELDICNEELAEPTNEELDDIQNHTDTDFHPDNFEDDL